MLFKTIDKASGKVLYHKVDVTLFHGNLPKHTSGINKKRLDLEAVAQLYGWSTAEITKARECWVNIFRFKESDLTFETYLNMLKEENLTPSDVGNKYGKFNLARKGDWGGYTKDNCRFITRQENLAEQHFHTSYRLNTGT